MVYLFSLFFSYDVVFAFFFVCVFWFVHPSIGERRGCRPGGDNCLFVCFSFLAKDCLLTGGEQALL